MSRETQNIDYDNSFFLSVVPVMAQFIKIVNKNYRFEIILNNFYKEYVKNIDVFKIENTPFEKMLAIHARLCYYILS